MTNWKHKLRDRLLLVGAGIFCAVLSLLFLRLAGEQGITILTLVVLGADNLLLRRRVRELKQQLTKVKG